MTNTDSTVLTEAARLGAAGRFPEAHAALGRGQDRGHRLLRARLFAQEGRFGEAIGQWQAVLEDDPGNDDARAGIRRARAVHASGGSALVLRAHLIQAVLAAAVVVLAVLLALRPGQSAVDAAIAEGREQLEVLRASALDTVREVVERADRDTASAVAARSAELAGGLRELGAALDALSARGETARVEAERRLAGLIAGLGALSDPIAELGTAVGTLERDGAEFAQATEHRLDRLAEQLAGVEARLREQEDAAGRRDVEGRARAGAERAEWRDRIAALDLRVAGLEAGLEAGVEAVRSLVAAPQRAAVCPLCRWFEGLGARQVPGSGKQVSEENRNGR